MQPVSSIPMDEETLKKSTDCIYYLASPVTCKKGSECEFRHSDAARNNPRDCWYWFNGICLNNSSCTFRHPPLEGLPGGTSSTAHKSRVPCIYFNQGYCSKGDKCPYLHGQFSGGDSAVRKPGKVSAAPADPQSSSKETHDGGAVSNAEKDTVQGTSQFSGNKAASALESKAQVSQSFVVNQPRESSTLKLDNAKPVQPSHTMPFQPTTNITSLQYGGYPVLNQLNNVKVPHVQSEQKFATQVRPLQGSKGNQDLELAAPDFDATQPRGQVQLKNRSRMRQPADERLTNGNDHEDILGGSSPGFDVLVDDGPEHLRHPEEVGYLHDMEVGRGMLAGQDYTLRNRRDFSYYDHDQPDQNIHDQSGYYEDHANYEQNMPRGGGGGYDRIGRKRPGAFDDRISDGRGFPDGRDRRSLSSDDNLRNNVEDLRHMLTKRRRNGGSSLVENSAKRRNLDGWQGDAPYNTRRPREIEGRKQQDVIYREGNSRRLHGRPQGDQGFKGKSDVGFDRRSHGRTSSPRHGTGNFRSKYRDMDKKVSRDGSNASEARASKGASSRSGEVKSDSVDFAGPKTLAQIKQEKNRENGEERSANIGGLLENMPSKSDDACRDDCRAGSGKFTDELGGEPDFEGPKPFSDILKAKRKSAQLNDNNFDEHMPEEGSSQVSHKPMVHEDVDAVLPEDVVEDASVPHEKDSSVEIGIQHQTRTSEDAKTSDVETEHKDAAMDGVEVKDDGEYADHEYELDQEEHEDQMQEDDFLDDEDDDDAFAKKIGGFFS